MNFPPVRPLGNRTPWSAPQTIEAVPEVRTIRPAIASGAVVQARDAAPVREAHRYAQVNGSIVIALNAAEPILALTAPQNFRNMLMLRNSSGAIIYVDFGREASLNSILSMPPGTTILFDTVVPQDDVYAFSPLGATLSIGFSNINFLERTG
jgi:hypothetical protein